MRKRLAIYAAAIMFLMSGYANGQVSPRVAGLEKDSVYMSLLKEELTLRQREDSLTKAVSSLRERLRDDAANRNLHAANILRIEGDIFETRNNIGKIAGKTSAIEQEFIVKNLTDAPSAVAPAPKTVDSSNDVAAFLTANPYFKAKLPADDYKALLEAERKEAGLIRLINDYGARYDTLALVARQYMAADSASVADSLWLCYTELKASLSGISGSVKSDLDMIADTKMFSYTLLLDMLNRDDLIGRLNEQGIQSRDQTVQLEGNTESLPVSSYPIRKRLILDYEKTLAGALGMNKALDSLKKAETGITSMAFDFPPIELQERLFLDYKPITIHSPALYNTANPIPALTVYEKGTIYRILLGSFQRAQPVSVFRGAYPVGMLRDEEGKYKYYAGGFASLAEAESALEQMKKAGFTAPKIAMWDYGDYSLPDETQHADNSQPQHDSLFRVDISGTGGSLADEIKTLIGTSAPGKDISKIGDNFSVGTFNTDGEAEKLAGTLREKDKSLSVTVAPVSSGN